MNKNDQAMLELLKLWIADNPDYSFVRRHAGMRITSAQRFFYKPEQVVAYLDALAALECLAAVTTAWAAGEDVLLAKLSHDPDDN